MKAPDQLKALDWTSVAAELDAGGSAVIENLLSEAECQALAARYADDSHFRSRVVMARHGFGRGEYKYFAYPLPELIDWLRLSLRCHAAGQRRPTPLLLRYGAEDYNCLHQHHRPVQGPRGAIG